MSKTTQRPLWKIRKYIRVRNISEHNLPLHLPTGRQRIDRGRTLLLPPEALELPELRDYTSKGWLRVENK